MTARRIAAFSGAAAVGLWGGWWLARSYDRAHRGDLFAPSARRRFAALGWIESNGGPESLPLMRDYVEWEHLAPLRSRARRVIAALEVTLS